MTKLERLFNDYGQSPWLDNLTRPYLRDGTLARFVADGIRGVTANPTIFARAIEGSDAYDEQFRSLIASEETVLDAYWELVVDDVKDACAVLRPTFDASRGTDGFVSIEVAPELARDTDGTIAAARDLHERIALPNLFVKIPATAEGIPAIRTMISEGRSINVTLIFSLHRYAEVIDAYLEGLETFVAHGGDPASVQSVASFFVSRVDTEVDHRLEATGRCSVRRHSRATPRSRRPTRVRAVPRAVRRCSVATSQQGRRTRTAPPVGVDVHEEPGVPRHALRRQPHRPRHREHAAGDDHRRVRGSRPRRAHSRRRRRRCAAT